MLPVALASSAEPLAFISTLPFSARSPLMAVLTVLAPNTVLRLVVPALRFTGPMRAPLLPTAPRLSVPVVFTVSAEAVLPAVMAPVLILSSSPPPRVSVLPAASPTAPRLSVSGALAALMLALLLTVKRPLVPAVPLTAIAPAPVTPLPDMSMGSATVTPSSSKVAPLATVVPAAVVPRPSA